MTRTDYTTITIRTGSANDRDVVRIAALDSSRVPAGEVLIAEADGEARAALSLTDGSIVADPFSRTADLTQLLRLQAARAGAQISRAPSPRRILLPRAA
jgi:hypothetical protein